jgi:threonine dehydrogenase-like Zn-dependent dehydrogenase
MLVYRGQAPADMPLDDSLPALDGTFQYPFKYGYSSVGQVVDVGPGVAPAWRDRQVFSFQPHQSFYLAAPSNLLPLPDGVSPDDAVFLPNFETAVNFVMDGRPMIGERVAVFGLGIVGLLTTALLAAHPLDCLAGWDRYPRRRQAARSLGADHLFDPFAQDPDVVRQTLGFYGPEEGRDGFDLLYELSGSPAALNTAISLAGFAARVVIGSWYGTKTAQLDLGGRFHRSRLRLISSQVSSLSPDLLGRWNKDRRIAIAWQHLARLHPARFITHRFPLAEAARAFRLLADHPEETIQVVLVPS